MSTFCAAYESEDFFNMTGFSSTASSKGKSDPSFEFTLIYLKILISWSAVLDPDKLDARDHGIGCPYDLMVLKSSLATQRTFYDRNTRMLLLSGMSTYLFQEIAIIINRRIRLFASLTVGGSKCAISRQNK